MKTNIRFLLALAVASLLLISCRSTRERKDDRAVNRVTASRPLLSKVKAPVDSLWPCIVDTVTRFKPGRVDSIPYEVLVPIEIDTVSRQRLLDSMLQSGVCWDAAKAAYNQGFKDAKKKLENVKIPVSAPDTIYNTVVDRRGLDIANAARLFAEHQTATLQGTISTLQSTADSYRKERNKWMWSFISLLVLAGITAGVALYLKLKPKLLPL